MDRIPVTIIIFKRLLKYEYSFFDFAIFSFEIKYNNGIITVEIKYTFKTLASLVSEIIKAINSIVKTMLKTVAILFALFLPKTIGRVLTLLARSPFTSSISLSISRIRFSIKAKRLRPIIN